jgi:hypothetical protein
MSASHPMAADGGNDTARGEALRFMMSSGSSRVAATEQHWPDHDADRPAVQWQEIGREAWPTILQIS